jgi:flagellar hook-associated protein 2
MEIAGIDAESIVTQLMQIERIPLDALQRRKDNATAAASAIDKVRSNLDAFRLAAARLADTSTFDRFTSSVSRTDLAAATISGTANVGSLTFTVDRLAQAHGLRSIGTVASASATVAAASFISVAAGTRSVGIDTVRAGAGLGAGTTTLQVTQASAGATTTGAALAAPVTITATVDDTIDVSVNGVARTVTIGAGTYNSADDLAAAVQSAFDASGGGVDVALDGAGALRLTTTAEGSSSSLQITGGTALAATGLAVQATAVTGTDGIIDVGGTLTTVTSAVAGQAVAVDTGSGTLDITLSGGLRVGDVDVKTVSTGTGSLADVAAAINGANGGVSAAAVQVSPGAWRLQLTSRTTGDDGRIAIDAASFTNLGGMIESSAAQNARITIGQGAGAYEVEASTNTFSNVLGGVTITAKTASTDPVTVNVSRNDEALASDIAALIGAANTLLADIKVQTRFDPATRTSGLLAGNSTIRRLADDVRSAVADQVGGMAGAAGLPSTVGIERSRDGSFTFDKAKFLAAVADDPSITARLFGRGGTGTGSVTFASASVETRAGSYDIEITTAATQATSTTLFAGGALASSRIGIRAGSTTVTVDVTAGQTATQIVDALNGALVESGLGVVAEADGSGLRLRSDQWGSAGSFEVNTDVLGAGAWDALAGVDVAGTIGGTAATGIGRRLSIPTVADDPAAGLAVDVPGGVTGAIGAITYQPGLAARVVELATAITAADDGTLTTAKSSFERRVEDFTDQMNRLEDRLLVRELSYRRQFSSLQTLLSGLQSQGAWLSSQIDSLPKLNTN